MGNAHSHRKRHNSVPQNPIPPSSSYKYGSPPHPHTTHQMAFLPYSHVDSTLRALAAQAEGFGRFAIGGLHGPLFHVTTLAGYISFSFSILSFCLLLILAFSS